MQIPSTSHPAARMAPLIAYASLAASTTLVGSYVGLSKLLVAAFPVFLLAWLRFGIAALSIPHWTRRRPAEPALSRHDHVLLFWESFLGNFLFSICMLYGVKATSALAAGVVMAAMPAAVALLSHVFLDQRVTPRVAWATALAAGGIALFAWAREGGQALAQFPWWGYALLIGAVFCEASYVVIGKRLTATLSTRRISALINLWGFALVTPFGVWQAISFDFAGLSPGTWALLVFYALAASVISVWLWMEGLRHVPAPQAGVFMVMLPVGAALVGVLWLGESFGRWHALAFALALGGLLLATWPARDRGA